VLCSYASLTNVLRPPRPPQAPRHLSGSQESEKRRAILGQARAAGATYVQVNGGGREAVAHGVIQQQLAQRALAHVRGPHHLRGACKAGPEPPAQRAAVG